MFSITRALAAAALFVAPWMSYAEFEVQQSKYLVGSMQGAGSVSPMGGAIYNLPITLPVGAAGVSPSFSVNYDSDRGPGLLGQGWNLSGLQSISRCPETEAIDSINGYVRKDITDKLCLNGARLVVVKGEYGQQGSEYRTFNDQMAQISLLGGSIQSLNSYFEVKQKNGDVLTFGGGAELTSTLPVKGVRVPSAWNLATVEDRYSNYIEYTYESHDDGLLLLPMQVAYAAHRDTGEAAQFKVEFQWEDSPVPAVSWVDGQKIEGGRVLASIDVSTFSGAKIRDYTFEYDREKRTNVAVLHQINRCEYSVNESGCLMPLTFAWTSEELENKPTLSGNLGYQGKHLLPAERTKVESDIDDEHDDLNRGQFLDVNLDGLDDWVYPTKEGIYVYQAQVTGAFSEATLYDLGEAPKEITFGAQTSSNFVDIDGDSIADWLYFEPSGKKYSGNRKVPDGTGFWAARFGDGTGFGELKVLQKSSAYTASKSSWADIDRDGHLDWMFTSSGKLSVFFGKNRELSQVSRSVTLNQYGVNSWGHNTVADINGDGALDLVVVGVEELAFWSVDSKTLTAQKIGQWPIENEDSRPKIQEGHRLVFLDFNGDGIADLADYTFDEEQARWSNKEWPSGEYGTRIYIRYGHGDGTFSEASVLGYKGLPDRIDWADVTGDGLPDPSNKGLLFKRAAPKVPAVGDQEWEYALGTSQKGLNTKDMRGPGIGRSFATVENGKIIHHVGGSMFAPVVQMVLNGPDDKLHWVYARTTQPEVYENVGGVPDSARLINPSKIVVSEMVVREQTAHEKATTFKYGNFAVDKTVYGSQGFGYREESNKISGAKTVSYYSQEFPYTGKLLDSKEFSSSGKLITESLNTYQQIETVGGAYMVLPDSTEVKRYSLNGQPLSLQTSESSDIDSFGNVGSTSSSTTDLVNGIARTKTATHTYLNDESNWILGRILTTNVQHSGEGKTSTKSVQFQYDSATGALHKEITEPLAGGTPEYLSVTYQYDERGYKRSKQSLGYGTDFQPLQRATSYTYQISESVDGAVLEKSYAQNSLGHLVVTTVNKNRGVTISTKGANGLVQRNEYDLLGRLRRTVAPTGIATEVQYNWLQRSCLWRNWLGWQLNCRQWDDGNLSTEESLSFGEIYGANSEQYPDPAPAWVKVTKTTGQAPTTEYYDDAGNVLRTSTVAVDGRVINKDTRYDIYGRPRAVSRPYFEGEPTYWATSTYDEIGRLSQISEPTADGSFAQTLTEVSGYTITTTDKLGNQTTKYVDAWGKPRRVKDALGGEVNYQYDQYGNLYSTRDAIGQTTTISYDGHGRKTSLNDPATGAWEYKYNSYGELEYQKDAALNVVQMRYDEVGRMVQRIEPEGTTTWTYDQDGDDGLSRKGILTSVLAPGGYSQTFKHDGFRRVIEAITSFGGNEYILQTGYDAYGRPELMTYPDGFETQNVYGPNGQLVAVKSPQNSVQSYDRAHLQTQLARLQELSVQAIEKVAEYEAEILHYQQQAEHYQQQADAYRQKVGEDNPNVAKLYAQAKRLRDFVVPMLQSKRDYFVNDLHQLYYITLEQVAGIGGHNSNWDNPNARGSTSHNQAIWGWVMNLLNYYFVAIADNGDRVIQAALEKVDAAMTAEQLNGLKEILDQVDYYITLAEAAKVKADEWQVTADDYTGYSAMLESILDDENNITWWRADQTDEHGRITRAVYGNGLINRRYYDAASGQLQSLFTGQTFNQGVQSLNYVYDADNNVLERYDDALGDSSTFTYDVLQRIKTYQYGSADEQENDSWQYDALGNILYSDSVGNYRYEYNANQAYMLTATDKHGAMLYDNKGNVTNKGAQQLTWASFGKPTQIADADQTLAFKYGPDRARYQQTITNLGVDAYNKTIDYVGKAYERITIARGAASSVQHKHHIYAAGELVATHTTFSDGSDSAEYMHSDGQGSINTITNQRGEVTSRYRYRPFGEQITLFREDQQPALQAGIGLPATQSGFVRPGANGNTRGYTGHEQLNNGLIHMNGRVYDPTLARFLSADPLVQAPDNTQSYNRYAYVINNPLKYTDPSGYSFLDDVLGWIGDFIGKYGRIILAIAITALVPVGAPLWQSMLAGFASGLVASGGDFKAGLIGAISAGIFHGIGDYYEAQIDLNAKVGIKGLTAAQKAQKVFAHGLAGGAQSYAQGGKFGHGFLGTSITQSLSGKIGGLDTSLERVAAAAVVGGTVSELTGGKFANGALTSAFSQAFNENVHSEEEHTDYYEDKSEGEWVLVEQVEAEVFRVKIDSPLDDLLSEVGSMVAAPRRKLVGALAGDLAGDAIEYLSPKTYRVAYGDVDIYQWQVRVAKVAVTYRESVISASTKVLGYHINKHPLFKQVPTGSINRIEHEVVYE